MKGDIKSCAGNQGTQITVEDLFYNMPQRKQFFKSPSDEFGRIMDVVCKYSVHNANVSFTITKQGEGVSLRTPPNSTHRDNIRIVYGTNVVDDMKSIECEDEHFKFKMFALTTNVKYSSKKFTLLLFINHRLVDSTGTSMVMSQLKFLHLNKPIELCVYFEQLSKTQLIKSIPYFCRKEIIHLYTWI